MTKKEDIKETKVATPEKVSAEKKVESPVKEKEASSSQASAWIAVAVALIVGVALGAGVMFSQSVDESKDSVEKEVTTQKEPNAQLEEEQVPSETMAEPPTETPTPNETMAEPPTETPTPTVVGTTPTTVILEDQLSGNRFEYALTVPSNSNVVKDPSSGSFEVKFASAGTLFVEQRYEAYENEFASYTTLSGKLGTFYRVSDSYGYISYVESVQQVGTCSSIDGPIPAPCGLSAYSIASKNFLAAFTCDGASNAECDTVMETVEITKL